MKVPNTISDAQMDKLRKQREKVDPGMFDDKVIKQRIATGKQKDKANQS